MDQSISSAPFGFSLWSLHIFGINKIQKHQHALDAVGPTQKELVRESIGVLIEQPVPVAGRLRRVPASGFNEALQD